MSSACFSKVKAAVSLLLLFCGCGTEIDEKSVFKYPVTVVKMPEITGELTPVLFSELDYPCRKYRVFRDSVIVAYDPSSQDHCFFSLVNINSADTLVRVGRRGRAEGEMISPPPFIEIDGEYAYIGDSVKSKCYKLNLTESIRRKTTIIDETLDLEHSTTLSPLFFSVFQDKLVCFNTMMNSKTTNLDGSPHFMVFDLSDSSCIDEFHCFGNVPYDQKPGMIGYVQQTLYCSSTSNKQTCQLCFANFLAPQINFLAANTGDVRGIRFGREMRLSLLHPYDCFISTCSDENRIYAIFDGTDSTVNLRSRGNVKLMVFDWDGNVLGNFLLDGYYLSCEIAGDSLLMTRLDKANKLFSLSLEEIISACPGQQG